VSYIPLLTGINLTEFSAYEKSGNFPVVRFNESISSRTSGDEVRAKFFGMGDAFGNQYNISNSLEENAGYFYTGFTP
ncbi:hypothetical protein ACLNBY_10325, partial [Streptococcus pneumoniae]|uniref:hypothetical protein n=1 Tax=Streptococcus pneumoniae TaxID=1313 RepID=UPI00398F0AED